MIKTNIQEAFNKQINAELYSAYLYLSMSAYFESASLPGLANWMRVQAQEEVSHAMKFYSFIVERGGKVTLKAIEGPPVKWNSPLHAFEAAYKHEQKVTGLINGLVDLALKEKDHASHVFLQWFVSEQVEEEASADEIVQKLKRIKNAPHALYMLDKEMGQRVFTMPAAGSE
jgi:ferritin